MLDFKIEIDKSYTYNTQIQNKRSIRIRNYSKSNQLLVYFPNMLFPPNQPLPHRNSVHSMVTIKQSLNRQRQHENSQRQNRTLSPQIRIYNRNVYLRQAYKSMMNKKYQEEIEKMANSEKLDIGSYRILKEKIERFIEQTIKKVKKQNIQHEENYKQRVRMQTNSQQQQPHHHSLQGLTYQQMCTIIYHTNQHLNRASQTLQVQRLLSQIWLYLKNYDIQSQFLPTAVLSTFLNLLMDPKGLRTEQIQQLMMTIEPFGITQELKEKFVRKYPQLKDQAMDDVDIFRLWFVVKQKYNVYMKHQRSTSSLHKHYPKQHHKFHPTISQNSRIMAQKSLNKYLSSQTNPHYHQPNTSHEQQNELHQYLSLHQNTIQRNSPGKLRQRQSNQFNYHQILYRRKLQKELITQKINQSNNYRSEQYNSRKATPMEVKEIVEKMYFVPQKKTDIDHKALKEEQELKTCTFFPTTTHSPIKKNQNVSVHGFQKEVNRLKKGRQEKLKLKQTYQNLGRPKNLTSRSRTPSFIQRDIPKLILQVNIGAGRIQKIKLHGNQDPKIVAKKFINKHNLESSMMSVLQQLIDQNLRNL